MAANAFYECTLKGVSLSQATISRFWYRQTTGSDGADELAGEIVADLIDTLRTVMCSSSGFTGLRIYNHNDPTDFHESDFAVLVGDNTNTPLPSGDAVYLGCSRGRTDMRNGGKRLYGIPEGSVTGNIIDSGYMTSLEAVAVALGADLADGSGNVWQPVIVRYVPYTTSSGSEAYRPPTTITSSDYYRATNWFVSPLISTQRSRRQKSL